MNELGRRKWAIYGFEVKYIDGEPNIVALMHTGTLEMEFRLAMFDTVEDAVETMDKLSADHWSLLDFKINDLDDCLQVLIVGYRPTSRMLPSGNKVIMT